MVANIFTLYNTDTGSFGIMNTSVNPAPGYFFSSLVKRFEMPGFISKRNFCQVGKSNSLPNKPVSMVAAELEITAWPLVNSGNGGV